ncbi:LysE family translocator [Pseudomonas putida]|jgi:threonine/homoserine/homoserine lactone efflux protein|uniref:LysE family translocator n=1 Tax=Pseudomonas putida TaxID=303 RepID=UPI00236403EE|nr:LysE family translocator [Pseudomonas putida]MDD2053968.1 LysE family translocator [Pseudomonas putida]
MSVLVSMAAFALATSITPGPVNVVALSSGVRYGLRASLWHVTGATLGFTLLLLLIGLGLHELLARWPFLTQAIQWGGCVFLLFMAYKLAVDNGAVDTKSSAKRPSMIYGALMQWLNPKAWMACVAGTGVFASNGEAPLVWFFAAVYFVVCWSSIACWAYAGSFLRHYLENPRGMRLFNRTMAVLLAVSALYLLLP